MTEAAKATGSRNVFKMPKATQQLKINLYAITSSGKQLADGASIVFGDQFFDNIDMDDALKANNFGENIAIHKQSKLLSLEARKNVVADDSVSLNIWNLKQQQYSIDVVINASSLDGYAVYLSDKYLSTLSPLKLNDTTSVLFKVNSAAASLASDRFSIVFKSCCLWLVNFVSNVGKRNE